MNLIKKALHLWRKQSIAFKCGVGIGILLFLIILVASTGYLSLHYVRTANNFIRVSTEIQRLVIEMDRGMEKARHHQGGFFLHYPKIGLKKAHENYAQPSMRKITRVIFISKTLRDMISTNEVSEALRKSNIDLNLYLSSAKRFADTSIESFELVTRLATPGDGLEAMMDKRLTDLNTQLADDNALSGLLHEMEHLIARHRSTRERFLMQSAHNITFKMRNRIDTDSSFDTEQKEKLNRLLNQIKDIADEISDIDVAINTKFKDFLLQEEASDFVSENLVALAKSEVEKSQQKIMATHRLAATILVAVTFAGLITALFLASIFNGLITRRIIRLTESAGQLRRGNLDIIAEEGHPDEIGHLGKTFNFMATRIKKQVKNLEQKVHERTLELSNTNKNLQKEVHDRKQAEERFRLAAATMSDLIYEWNIIDNSLLWFGDVDAAIGFESHTFPRTIEAWQDRIHPDDAKCVADGIQYKETSSDPIHYEYRIRHKDGSFCHWFDSAVPVLGEDGRPYKWVGICTDITENKRAEIEKQNLEKQLRQSQKMEAIGTLAGGIAHDFNNILSAVMGYAELAEINMPESSPAADHIAEVFKASSRAKKLIQHILAFSRKEIRAKEPIQISRITRAVLTLLRTTIPATIRIEETIDPDSGTILASPTEIHQVLMNLCTNACQAMEETGGVLYVTLDSTQIREKDLIHNPARVKLKRGNYIRISISDTGPGIDPQIMNNIFDPYFTTKGIGKGSGMGLTVAHGIVGNCDGIIEVESKIGKGTCFHLYFPKIEHEEKSETMGIPTINYTVGKGEKILVVDDEKSLVAISKLMLKEWGYEVTARGNSPDTLALFRSHPDSFDIVITDQTMPDMTGVQLAREIRKIRPDIPIILCTEYNASITRKKADSIGINKIIMKPVQYDKLARAIRQLLDTSGN